ncbi:MAG: hypothetical protein NT040_03585 [Bacteroidetes bacterium]|nr:hypothetical protein [Bacteroidota bacterium]
MFLTIILLWMASCRNGVVEHIHGTRLVILQKIPVEANLTGRNFNAALELLYPHECHDTAFIQDHIFLERIDIKESFTREFVIHSSPLRSFLSRNDPHEKRTLRENLFYLSAASFQKHPDKPFLTDAHTGRDYQLAAIRECLSEVEQDMPVYLIGSDTAGKNCEINGVSRMVYTDVAKLNCRIVEDLRKKSKEELRNTMVTIILLPPGLLDNADGFAGIETGGQHPGVDVKNSAGNHLPSKRYRTGLGSPCPPDSVVAKTNRKYMSVIEEFRNLLYYIATTSKDEVLKTTFRDDANKEIHNIPNPVIEGIPGNDLNGFLNSGFSRNVVVFPVSDNCGVITGIRIIQQ